MNVYTDTKTEGLIENSRNSIWYDSYKLWNIFSNLRYTTLLFCFHFSKCVDGAFQCEEIPDCYTDISCPKNQEYLEDSDVCQTTCEEYIGTCGPDYVYSGCGCPAGKTMGPDVRHGLAIIMFSLVCTIFHSCETTILLM